MKHTLIVALFIAIPAPVALQAQEPGIVLENGVIRREIDCSNHHVTGKSFVLSANKMQFIREASPEFSVLIDDIP
ncbi:MAG: hypothetical protein LBN71_00590, partial [Tannerella sp.]|nr:hypothetical protein [Tannerella sp.]